MIAMRRLSRRLLGGSLIVLAACGGDSNAPDAVKSVIVSPTASALMAGDTLRLSAIVKDARGQVLTDRVVTWTSSDSTAATVSTTGLVRGVGARALAITITATSEGVSGSASIAVTAPPAVTVMAINPDTGPLAGGTSVTITGTNFFSVIGVSIGGSELVGRAVLSPTQISGTTAAATIRGTNDVTVVSTTNGTGTCPGCFRYVAVPPPDTVRYATLAAGAYHTCGLTSVGAANCWGYNAWGQLGNGSESDALTPQAVRTNLLFATINPAGGHTCGLVAGGTVYCWGSDLYGELGAGGPGPEICSDPNLQFPCSTLPLGVTGAHTFSTLSAGWALGCALTASGDAYCWGDNAEGELGIGGDTTNLTPCDQGPCSRVPLAVAGGLAFRTLATGTIHVCGLTAPGTAYCWGNNSYGQLGVGVGGAPDVCVSGPCSRVPLAVAGGHTFTALRAGLLDSCGLEAGGDWYCWGLNNYGQLGNGITGPESCPNNQGTALCSGTPTRVSVGTFTAVFPGRRHSCGLTAAGSAYCWGWDDYGQLGDGTTNASLTPVPVASGLTFASLSPYSFHTCGVTTDGVPYCWGGNDVGQLGDGTTLGSSTPVLVVPPSGAAAAAAVRAVAARRGKMRLSVFLPSRP